MGHALITLFRKEVSGHRYDIRLFESRVDRNP